MAMNSSAEMRRLLRNLPAVHALLLRSPMQELAKQAGSKAVSLGLRHALKECRRQILEGERTEITELEVMNSALTWVQEQRFPTLLPVINATGVLLHTNLGRAPLSAAALQAVQTTAAGYCTLEYDLIAGQRSDRYSHCRVQLQELTGAEDAVVVNNNAAALLLCLTAFCRHREVIISRGQLVEIGGGFRIPDILQESGARLVEVGTTNRTYVRDYLAAISERTAAILYVHASNFSQSGFVHQPSLVELAESTKEVKRISGQELLLIHDLGSGCLLNVPHAHLGGEQTVSESVSQGAHLTTFSGDKMLGGPQAGILVGRQDLVDTLMRNPLLRALRLDKMGLAALSATLDLYRSQRAFTEIPLLAMGAQTIEELQMRAESICTGLVALGIPASIVNLKGAVGGGSLPSLELPSVGIALSVENQVLAAESLRAGTPPVVGRLSGGRINLDLRTVLPSQDEALGTAVAAFMQQ